MASINIILSMNPAWSPLTPPPHLQCQVLVFKIRFHVLCFQLPVSLFDFCGLILSFCVYAEEVCVLWSESNLTSIPLCGCQHTSPLSASFWSVFEPIFSLSVSLMIIFFPPPSSVKIILCFWDRVSLWSPGWLLPPFQECLNYKFEPPYQIKVVLWIA